ncbi:hypothetical protein [Brevibacillus sp. NRS-1366]|uniref:hypothetical protein n=1 Tax=Brevibacillus sp. NRS-1366 TaxID=3233899 RepID=UPI003D262099
MFSKRFIQNKEEESYASEFQVDNIMVSKDVEENQHILQNEYFREVDDLTIRHIHSSDGLINVVIVYIENLVDRAFLDRTALLKFDSNDVEIHEMAGDTSVALI